MIYCVVITENAKANLRHYYLRAAQNALETAARWLDRFHVALQTLASNSERCVLAPENEVVDLGIRQFIFGKRISAYRALFRIVDQSVLILHIRRAAMDQASPDEIFG